MRVRTIVAAFALLSFGLGVNSYSEHETIQEPLSSPRLAALEKQLKDGARMALEGFDTPLATQPKGFWQEVARQGTPLIEPIKGDNQNVLVTFLWRAKEETKNVVVIGAVARWNLDKYLAEKQSMTRLLDTDIWYKTYRVRSDARFTYLLSPNNPLLIPSNGTCKADPKVIHQPDPLNPCRYTFIRDSENLDSPASDYSVSVVELPAAPSQPWVKPQPGVPAGQVELHRLKSKILNNERRVWVYTPPTYMPCGEPYGHLLLFDGWEYTQWIPTPTILDNLLAAGKIPPLVAVMLDAPNRYRELACNPSFVDFLTEELLPWIRQRYHITFNPSQTIVGGSSLGGLAAAFAGFQRPDVFGNVLSQSGSFWWSPEDDIEREWLARQFAVTPKLPLRFYLEVGLFETAPVEEGGPTMLMVNRHLRDVLQAKGYSLHYAEFNGRHEFISWQGTLADGLTALIDTDNR